MKTTGYSFNVWKCPRWSKGDIVPTEAQEQVTFFSRLRLQFPDTYGILAIHPRNEGMAPGAQIRRVIRAHAEGMVKGAADIIIPGRPALVIELKRRDPTKSRWQEGQIEYLEAAQRAGCVAGVAFGADAAWEAFREWRGFQPA